MPVFVDVDTASFTMDPALLEAAITPKTKAIIPVHLYGQMADMDPIMDIAAKHGLVVVEDACQAHGAEYKGRRAGSIGDVGCFSFYPGKNLGAYGEAGGVVTNDRDVASRIKMLRDHGQSKKYSHAMIGVNSRMDGFQGAVLGVKLKYLALWNHTRIRNAERYCELLSDVDSIVLPKKMEYAHHVYHIFAVRVPSRDSFLNAMTEKGINCGVHYPFRSSPGCLQLQKLQRGKLSGGRKVCPGDGLPANVRRTEGRTDGIHRRCDPKIFASSPTTDCHG